MAKKFKTRVKRTPAQTQTNLEKQVLKDVAIANQKLKSLERKYKSGTWASRKLMNRLNKSTLNAWQVGRIKVRKGMTNTQLRAIQKATNQFLVSKTSTKKGIGEVKKSTLDSLKLTLTKTQEMTDEEIETAYNMLGDNDFDYFNKADRIGASALWILIDDAIESNMSESSFVDTLSRYMDFSNDLDAKERASRLYQKYVL